ncbi:MAG: hypothetical protein EA378_00705 [Phycisphaerales bacterium]|nr:MAG: hypothetical protein EA378_00705 [Phycisphaerales bacterium]
MAPLMTMMLILTGGVLGIALSVLLIRYALWPAFKGTGWLITHVVKFIFGMLGDTVRAVGAVMTVALFAFLVIANIAIGRWSASAHFGRAVSAEVSTLGACLYRVLIGHPARFLLLHGLTEGLEERLPAAIAAAPTRDTPTKRTGQFEGYTIIGSLKGGGAGRKLYVAAPPETRRAAFERRGLGDVDQVVIKSFSLADGSSLPQIVRESRALDAARRLGLVLDHELNDERFFYIMRYVPGEPLGLVTTRLHAHSGAGGLNDRDLRSAMTYAADLVRTLGDYHRGGLWHKDVKPDNIIIHDGRAHVVDLGLVTPLRSAMTLTTHGTEYFRDPELVRMALRGVKVHQVDGAKFDVYAAGAVLFSMIENSFPAHGGLSQITKRCPDAVRWIVRRAMAEYDKRYASAAEMLADLDAVRSASDPFAVKPAMLPSVAGAADATTGDGESPEPDLGFGAAAAAAGGARRTPRPEAGPHRADAERTRPSLVVANWWTGRYRVDGATAEPGVARSHEPAGPRRGQRVAAGVRAPAKQQLANARSRAEAARQRARTRVQRRRGASGAARQHASGGNAGVAIALFLFLAVCVGFAAMVVRMGTSSPETRRELAAVFTEGVTGVASGVGDRTPAHGRSPYALPRQDPSALPAHLSLEGTTYLVISDFRPPVSEAFRTSLAGGVQAVRDRGARVLGVGAWESTEADPDADAQAVELTARLRASRGRRPLESTLLMELLPQVRRGDTDVVLWLEPLDAESGGVRYAMITKDAESVVSWLDSSEEIPHLFGRTIELVGTR